MLGVEVQFDKNRTKNWYRLRDMQHYEMFVFDFFCFYSNFDFDQKIIDLYTGKIKLILLILVYTFFIGTSIDRDRFKNGRKFDSNASMCVLGPLGRHNVSHSVDNSILYNFKNNCRVSIEFLKHYGMPYGI